MYSKLLKEIKNELTSRFKIESDITLIKNVSGGCINQCFEFVFNKRKFFLKINSPEKFPLMFSAEKKGLELLANSSVLTVPLPVVQGQNENYQYLVLNYFERWAQGNGYFSDLGKGIALLHKNFSSDFGLDHDNYIGSLPQVNLPCKNFSDFFICNRLQYQVEIAINSNQLEKKRIRDFEKLFSGMMEIIPNEKPALLHGDLWSGNVMNSKSGPAIFDPAVYYGHRESDIAMTLLFGGFPDSFYRAYEEEFPLEKNWRKRAEIFNLYPLLVHLNLFGGSYKSEVESILKKFS